MSEVASSHEKSPGDPGFFPEDLSHRPRPLIFLVGLDKTGKDVHKRIFEAFTVHKSTKRPLLNYQLVQAAHVYPPQPKQRLNFEGYVPEGIIPVGWINKHLHKLPAAVVLFHELDWDSDEYEQRQTECASRISCLRHSLQGHHTRILLVLIQSRVFHVSHSGPPADQLASRRIIAILQACGIQSDQLFQLPHTERMMDCIIKIEHSFSEQAMHYYTHRIKTVRAHKDLLARPLHLSLFVRHQFKIGFFSELKKDNTAALKHYNASYTYLLEAPFEERNAMEVKMIAGILNYKICQLTFVNTPRQAISTFRKHIDTFRRHEGPSDLSFQHQHWLAAENSYFARMFSDAIEGIQTLNPGMFYIVAAEHARLRREVASTLPPPSEMYHPLQDPAPRFYGQYPWREGVVETEETDPKRRSEGLSYLQQKERRVEHNWEVIGLLCRAVNQFKKYSSRRLTASVKVQLAEEYFSAGDYKKILDLLLGTVALLYRAEHWWPLLDRVGELCITCSYIEKSYPFFLMLLLECISHYSCISLQAKDQLQQSLEKILHQQAPPPPARCPPLLRERVLGEWTRMCEKKELTHVKLDMNQLAGCIECKVFFLRGSFQADSVVSLQLHMFSSAPSPLPLRRISIHLSREHYSQFCYLSLSEKGVSFLLHPYSVLSHTFTFLSHTHDVTGSIHADSIHMDIGYIGEEDNITLTWSLPPVSWGSPSTCVPADFSKQWGQIENRCSTDIVLREAQIGLYIQTPSPSLVNDVHRVSLILENTETSDISNISFKLELLRSPEDSDVTSLTLDPSSADRLDSLTDFTYKLDSIPTGETYTKDVFVTSSAASVQEFHLLVSYEITCDRGEYGPLLCSCVKESRSSINIVYPFKLKHSLTSPLYLPLDSVRTEDPFLLHLETTSTCPWPIQILDSTFKLSNNLEYSQRNYSQIVGCVVEHEEALSETFCLQVPEGQGDNSNFSLGDYVIRWRRVNLKDEHEYTETTTKFPLPRAYVRDVPFKIKTELPAFGTVYQPLKLRFIIFNKTSYVQEFDAGVEDSPDFLFSGKKSHFFNILPRTEYVITYCLCPTSSGRCLLPKLWLRYLREPAPYEGASTSMIPSHLYVKP